MKYYALPDGKTISEDKMRKLLPMIFTKEVYVRKLAELTPMDVIRLLEAKGIPAFEILYQDALESTFQNDLADYRITEIIDPRYYDRKKR